MVQVAGYSQDDPLTRSRSGKRSSRSGGGGGEVDDQTGPHLHGLGLEVVALRCTLRGGDEAGLRHERHDAQAQVWGGGPGAEESLEAESFRGDPPEGMVPGSDP